MNHNPSKVLFSMIPSEAVHFPSKTVYSEAKHPKSVILDVTILKHS